MNLKERVLSFLESKRDIIVSGESIARALGVSRNSIWKAINALKKDGYPITSQSNTGYVLSKDADIFNASKIQAEASSDIEVVFLDEATSSNDIAKKLATEGAKEGTVVVVARQSEGRGRMGRSFISNEENGLYMSIILRPSISAMQSLKITIIGALATLEAIEETSGASCGIKWVNDIFIGDKKVCGILTEAALSFESGSLDYAVLGIGVNVTPPKNGFDAEIKDIATSIYQNKAPNDYKSILCAKIVDKFFHYYKNIEGDEYISLYRERSILIGKRVEVVRGEMVYSGIVVDIDNDANLVLRVGDEELKFNSGEARIKKR